MQTSELNAYPKVGLYTGSLGVDALAVWVLLIYLSQTAITFTKKVKVIVGCLPTKTWHPTFRSISCKSFTKHPTVGAFGEGSEDLHSLIHHLAISRVRVAGPQKGRRGQVRTEEAELAITTSFLRRSLSVVGVLSLIHI